MIVNNDNFAETLTHGVEQSTNMEIDETDKGILQMILSEGLYSDPIGSLIREYTSNALDANREVKNDEPIIVSLKPDAQGKNWFKVQDFGVGMSPDRVKNVISKYAASTKRGSADQLGYFGLGMKSGLAYADSFNIETIFDGVKYLYVMYKAEHNTKIDLISSFETEEGNGTTISIALKTGKHRYSWDTSYKDSEYDEFLIKIKEQLAYFEGVYFDIDGFDNDFQITSTELWKYSPLTKTEHMHLCLDNVYYPIDWEKLGLEAISFPVGLNFKVTDGLVPTPNREQLRMTPTIKEKIKERIKLVADEFITKYNETITAKENIIEAWEEIGNKEKKFEFAPGKTGKITTLQSYSSIEPTKLSVKGLEHINLKRIKELDNSIIEGKYSPRGGVVNNKYSSSFDSNLNIYRLLNTHRYPYYAITEKPSNIVIDFIKEKIGTAYFVYKTKKETKLGFYGATMRYGEKRYDIEGYYSLLELSKYPKNEWRQIITEYQSVVATFEARIKDISEVIPTPEFLAERKARRTYTVRTTVEKVQVNPKFGEAAGRAGVNVVFKEGTLTDINKLKNHKSLVIYGIDKIELNDFYDSFGYIKKKYKHRIQFALLSTRDFNKIKGLNIHNWLTIEEFMKGENRVFKQYVTAYRIVKFMKQTEMFDSTTLSMVKKLSTSFYDKMVELKNYAEKISDRYADNDFIKIALKFAYKNNLWDSVVIDKFNFVKNNISVFNFIKILKRNSRYGYEDMRQEDFLLAVEVLRGRKIRMNWQNYNIEFNDIFEENIFKVEPEEELEVEDEVIDFLETDLEDEEKLAEEDLKAEEALDEDNTLTGLSISEQDLIQTI